MDSIPLLSKILILLVIPIIYVMYKLIRSLAKPKIVEVKDKRTILLEKVKKADFPNNEVFVSVEDFFYGNEDNGSIGANIVPTPPSLQEFYDIFKEIEKSPKTENLLVRIADIEDTDWFYTDMVYLSGNYTLAEVKKMFKRLKPDEVYQGMMYNDKPSNIPESNPGNKAYSVWWD